jgi:hypothetical protein
MLALPKKSADIFEFIICFRQKLAVRVWANYWPNGRDWKAQSQRQSQDQRQNQLRKWASTALPG